MSGKSVGDRKTALITGASSGIGYEFARIFAKEGFHLVIVARSAEKLREIAHQLQRDYGVEVRVTLKDLSIPTSPTEIFEELQRDKVRIDVLVNNAGLGTYGLFAERDVAQELAMIQVNVTSLTHLTRLFLPEMVERRYGKILNVASTAAFQPGPLMAVYYATKAYVLFFSEAIRNELKGSGVTVTVLCPGPTESGFQKQAGIGETRLVATGMMDSRTVALAGYRGLMRNQSVVIPGLKNRFLAFAVGLVPRSFAAGMVRTLQEKRRSVQV